jgi:hypothetical protein
VILHFDRIENINKQQRRVESLFKYCHRCVLHVKSITEHDRLHHASKSKSNEQIVYFHDEESQLLESKKHHSRAMTDHRKSTNTFKKNKCPIV